MKGVNPPRIFLRFFRWFCHPELRSHIEGDLVELHEERVRMLGKRRADMKFVVDVMLLFRPGIIKPTGGYKNFNKYGMYKSYFKVALRNLLRHRSFTVINIAGLTLGIACALFIYLISTYELSYDRYHSKADRIYRINKGHAEDTDTGTPYGLAPVLRTEFPEVEDVGVIFKLNPEQSNVEINKEFFREPDTYIVQSQFFRLFDFNWRMGSPEKSLKEPQQAVIAQSIADKYFQGDAMGKVLRLNNEMNLIVTGIISDPPINTDFPIKIAISFATFEKNNSGISDKLDGGTNSFFQTYLLLHKGVDPSVLDPKLKKMVTKHLGKGQVEKSNFFSIQSLDDIHFNIGNFNQRLISKETIHTLQLIGLFVLLIACINFINLASAQAIKRAKEVGIRKTLGSSRGSLVFQFLCETFLITLLSVTMSYVIVSQLVSLSQSLVNIPLSIDTLTKTDTLLFIGAVLVSVTLLSGFYPAFILSGYLPVTVLKGSRPISGVRGLFVRKGLITFQFLVSQILIICTIVVIRQTNHFLSKPLGFNKEAVITFDLPDSNPAVRSSLRNNLLSHSEIKNVSFSLNTPSATINKWWANLKHASFLSEERSVEVKFIDSTYLGMFEIMKVAGTIKLPDQSGAKVIVNEALVREIGITDPEKALGERITYWDKEAIIIGVVKDFQTVSLRQGIHPVLLTDNNYFAKGSVKIDMTHADQAIAQIEKHWKESFPGNYFTYAFLDDQLATFYGEEKKMSRLLVSFASVAISIGCIGLFGLIAFVATQRSKEISIRKILGATLSHLAALLSADFIKLVLVAGLISLPIAYYFLNTWLQGFVNRIQLVENWWVFLLSIALSTLLALITVSFQTIKAALTDPVKDLRSE